VTPQGPDGISSDPPVPSIPTWVEGSTPTSDAEDPTDDA
jgi:hypothetical protein